MEGKQVIDAEEMVTKIKAAVDARIYPETVLIVRTDAIGMYGFEEALRRGEMYIEAGADVLFIEAPANKDQIKKIPSCFSRPCLINMAFVNQNDVDVRTLKRWGYAIAIYPIVALLGAIAGCFRMFNSLKTTGKQGNWRDIPFDFDELNQFFGLDKFKKLERKFSLKFQNKERAD
jgi:methylisocitrate lyase